MDRISVIRAGGRPAVVGLALAAGTILALLAMPEEPALGFLAVLLGFTGAVYLGFAIGEGRLRAIAVEGVAAAAFLALGALALALDLPVILAAGYLGHGVWDLVHHPRAVDTAVPRWYVPLCAAYDLPLGVFIPFWF